LRLVVEVVEDGFKVHGVGHGLVAGIVGMERIPTSGAFSERLSSELSSGSPGVLYYFVQLMDREGRSTGVSNGVATLAGAPLPTVRDLTAETTDKGVLLRWMPGSAAEEPAGTTIRLHRTKVILTRSDTQRESAATQPEGEDLLIEDGLQTGQVLDTNIHYGDTYEYRVQRVVRVAMAIQTLELVGQLSTPVQIVATQNDRK
jgi:hypothetical protein